MELPPEILSMIREYSRPCFKYFREYQKVLRLLQISCWPELKTSLEKTPLSIYRMLDVFVQAHFDRKKIDRDLYDHYRMKDEYFVYEMFETKRKWLRQQLVRSQSRERNKFLQLTFYVYGETKEIMEIKLRYSTTPMI
jgi:hypothetical protein